MQNCFTTRKQDPTLCSQRNIKESVRLIARERLIWSKAQNHSQKKYIFHAY
jgi:hypothetical protein